jgi:hypothetical protein
MKEKPSLSSFNKIERSFNKHNYYIEESTNKKLTTTNEDILFSRMQTYIINNSQRKRFRKCDDVLTITLYILMLELKVNSCFLV